MMETSIAQQTPAKPKLLTRNFILTWAALSIAYITILFTGLGRKSYLAQIGANVDIFSKQAPQPLAPALWELPMAVLFEFLDGIHRTHPFPEWFILSLALAIYIGIPIAISFCLVWVGRKVRDLLRSR